VDLHRGEPARVPAGVYSICVRPLGEARDERFGPQRGPTYTYTFNGITGQKLAMVTCNGTNYPAYPGCGVVGQNVYYDSECPIRRRWRDLGVWRTSRPAGANEDAPSNAIKRLENGTRLVLEPTLCQTTDGGQHWRRPTLYQAGNLAPGYRVIDAQMEGAETTGSRVLHTSDAEHTGIWRISTEEVVRESGTSPTTARRSGTCICFRPDGGC
jgi:hypothetical protein